MAMTTPWTLNESEDGESEDNEGLQKRRMLGQTGGHALASKPAGLP